MVKIFNAYFSPRTLLLAVSEVFLITLGMVAATYARFGADSKLVLFYESGLIKVGLVALVCVLCMYHYDLYDSLLLNQPREVTPRLIQVLGTTCLVLAVVYYIYPQARLGLWVFLNGMILVAVLLIAWRRLYSSLARTEWLAERVLLIGQGPLAASLCSAINKRPELGVRLLGYLGERPDAQGGMNGLAHLGNTGDVFQVV